MCKIKLICVMAMVAIFGLNQVHGLDDLASESEEYVAEQNLTNTRTSRVLKYPRSPSFMLRRRQPIKIRSRADHFPLRTQIRRVQNGVLPQNQPLRYGYESLKSSKYMPSKGSSLPYSNSVKGTSLRQQLLGVHPNGVHLPALSQQYIQNFKASPAFNGKIVIHPSSANQQQQLTQQQSQPQDNTYPKYIKPQQQQLQQQLGQQQQQQQQHQQQLAQQQHQQSLASQQQQQQQQQQQPDLQYPEFKQFPIPDQQQMQKYNEQHEKYLQQQKYLTPRDPMAYYQQQYHQQQQQQQQHLQQPQQQLQQQPPTYSVHQPSYLPAQKPVLHHNTQPSIPIHEVAESSAASSASSAPSASSSSASSSSAAQQSFYPHGVVAPAPAPPKMYSVYEENDMTELQNNDYQTAQYDSLEKEAQEYLRFMNTNEYFLPKRDPNYKVIDEETDRRQQYQQQQLQQQQLQQQQLQQQSSAAYAQQPLYQQNYQPSAYQPQSQTSIEEQQQQPHTHYGHHHHTDSSAAATASASTAYNQPIQVSKLFYQDESGHHHGGEPSTVVRTSYQTAYNANQFVVSSQDSKASKYLLSPQTGMVVSTQSPPSVNNIYSQVRQSPQQSNRTPEPLRFEFTERDAMIGGISYTSAPKTQLRYKAVDTPITPKLPSVENSTPSTTGSILSSTLRSKTYHSSAGAKPVLEVEDDPEDGDDMQQAGSNLYGRQPLQSKNKATNKNSSSTSTTAAPPNEQKDTEDYCERICAIVEDEHEEIVCGSDGYMYTSEAQMECYASCLHIDITIQGKGSCSAR